MLQSLWKKINNKPDTKTFTDTFDVLTITRSKTDDITERKLETVEYSSMNQFLKDISSCPIEMYIKPHNKTISADSLQESSDQILHLAFYEKIIDGKPGEGLVLGLRSTKGLCVNMMLKNFLQDDTDIQNLLKVNNIDYTLDQLDVFYSTK